jgi:NADH-quinone oxidoreductase subunit G
MCCLEKMVAITINDKLVNVPAGITVIQACELSGIEIPRFCYHNRLKIAGNCRMCLVEMVNPKSPKPVPSCATNVSEGMVINTSNDYVKKARSGVMEFLLANHPLDCPVCDQAGSCSLQDQAYVYGKDSSRYHEEKREVEDKNLGPMIKTCMTRCIHCTRCARFLEEVAGTAEIGAFGRGEHMEIDTFLHRSIKSELSGNIIDLCPVGALTSKPFAFKARPWELNKTNTIDIMDAMCSSIVVETKGNEVMRILPQINEDINEEWISDKTRFAYDGLKMQRIDSAYIRQNNKLQKEDYAKAINYAGALINENVAKTAAIVGDLCDIETAFALKTMLDMLGCKNYDCRQDGAQIDTSSRGNYILNSTIAGVENIDAVLIVGSNIRHDAPLLNVRLRKAAGQNKAIIANVGFAVDLTYNVTQLGEDVSVLQDVLNGKHSFSNTLSAAKNPIIIIGQSAICGQNGSAVLEICKAISKKYNATFNMLHKAAGRVGALDVGFTASHTNDIMQKCQSGEITTLICVGADELDITKLNNVNIIYIGTHGDKVAPLAQVVLPAACYTEKNALFANMEGRVLQTTKAVPLVGEAKEDCQIIIDVANALNVNLGFSNRGELLLALFNKLPVLQQCYNSTLQGEVTLVAGGGKLSGKIKNHNEDFFMSNYICRASKNMALCKKEFSL